MKKKTNTTAIGLFVIGAAILLFAGIIFIGSSTAFSKTEKYVLYFDESINGLDLGAKVKFKGVPIGNVVETYIGYNSKDGRTAVPVIIEIQKEKLFAEKGFGFEEGAFSEDFLRGLRAKLVIESLITGILFVDIDYYGAEYPGYAFENSSKDERVIPTLQSDLESIRQAVTQAVTNAGQINFREMTSNLNTLLITAQAKIEQVDVENLNKNLANLNELAKTLTKLIEDGTIKETLDSITSTSQKVGALVDKTNEELDFKELSSELSSALDQLTDIAKETKTILNADSDFRHQITLTMNEISTAARAVRLLAELLERSPNAILSGKKSRQP